MSESAGARLARELGAPRRDVEGKNLVPMLCAQDDSRGAILGRDGWSYELKLDGVRIVADKRGDKVLLGYRKQRDATDSYPEVADAVRALGEARLVLDGEVVAFDENGRPDFQLLAQRIQAHTRDARRISGSLPVVYIVFDVLAIGDYDVRGFPLEARKAIVDAIVSEGSSGVLRRHPTFDDGRALFEQCRLHGLEGVVAKRKASAYREGERSPDWVKVKCELHADLVVIGWTEGEGRRSRLGAIDLGAYDDGRLVVFGSAGSGLDERTIDTLTARLVELEVPEPVAEGRYLPKKNRRHVRPEMVVSVRYMGMTSDGLMRHPVFRGIRPDMNPRDCTIDGQISVTPRNADVQKDALCTYYECVAQELVPFLTGRATTPVKRDGVELPKRRIDDEAGVLATLASGTISFRAPLDQVLAFRIPLRAKGAAKTLVELAAVIGLPAVAKVGGAGAFDVLVSVRGASRDVASTLGALLSRLAAGTDASAVVSLESVVAPWAVISDRGEGLVSVPLDAGELESFTVDRATLAAARTTFAARPDAFRALHESKPDLEAAVARLEHVIREDLRP